MHSHTDPETALAEWRKDGADRLDPVRFHLLETLARRARLHEGPVRHVLDMKLDAALTAYRQRLATTAQEMDESLASPAAPTGLEALTELNRHIAASVRQASNTDNAHADATPTELKSIDKFRNTWSRISADKQLRQAMESGPDNAGPLNSHLLVLRSLTLMQDVAPAYLDRLMRHVDALMWLDQAAAEGNGKRRSKPAR